MPSQSTHKLSRGFNSSDLQIIKDNTTAFSTQGQELLSFLQDLQQNSLFQTNCSGKHINWYLYSDTVFDLNSTVLMDTETNVLKKGLHFAPI